MAHDDRHAAYQSSPPTQWGQSPHVYPHSHHGTPAQEYSGFNFSTPQMPMESTGFSSSIHQRPMAQQLQPLIMPQWPSMLNSQVHSQPYQPVFPQPVLPMQPTSIGPLQTPISATSTRSTSTPRKTLTDADRKRMCQYAEDHPNSKQTEIGAIFGVERSTVSKVLRQRDKYLLQDDGNRSPVKRVKGRSPDIERALAVWAKNQEKRGLPLTDDIIRDKARAFSAPTTSPENQQLLSSSWLEKFKLRNNLMGARSRKGSLAPDDSEGVSATASSSHTPSGTSPISPQGIGSPELHSAQSHDSLKDESPDSYVEFGRHGPFHSQSTNSLNSAFTDTAPSSFSPGPLSPTSPFYTPESGTAPGPFAPPLTARPILPAVTAANAQRPRSQTFPLLDQYISGSGSMDAATPRYVTTTILDSPMEEPPDPLINMDEIVRVTQPEERPHTVTPVETMRPPPLPARVVSGESRRELLPLTSTTHISGATSPEDAQRALEVVMSFIEQQPTGFLDSQESMQMGMHMGKLMEKLRLQSRGSN
ncbi:hypothetical protein LTR37_008707 [Vermiconidia calcicola]|uniref:Uncharacterized protein n=1 Tax=Vermiconidia calcicola TaxID=1690605 RepID=A0ACC3NCL8_9PEZI|nr:hypothetical protein LTR37_008707 [Vermiconidia calcicola]